MARDFNTDGAQGAFESDGGPPGGTPTPPTMTDPGPGGAGSTGDTTPSAPPAIEYSAPGAQGPVATKTSTLQGGGDRTGFAGDPGSTPDGNNNDMSRVMRMMSGPIPASGTYMSGSLGIGWQNTGGPNRVMFADGGEVGAGTDAEGDPKEGQDPSYNPTGGLQDRLTGALNTIDEVLQYGRQKYGLGGGQPDGQQGGGGQQAASGLLTPGGSIDADDGRGVSPGFEGDKKFSQFARDNTDDRRVVDNSPREGPETWLDHFRVLPDVAKADIQDMGRDLKNLYAPSQMSKDAGINDLGSTLDRGPLSDPDAVNEQYDNTQSQPPQQQYGVPTDDTEGRY